MKREEAIKIIKECKEKSFKRTLYTVDEYYAAMDMAIEALECEGAFLDKVLEILDQYYLWHYESSLREYVTVGKEIEDKIMALEEGEQE